MTTLALGLCAAALIISLIALILSYKAYRAIGENYIKNHKGEKIYKTLGVFLLFSVGAFAQTPIMEGSQYIGKTTTAIGNISSPLEGRLEYNTTLGKFVYWNGSTWLETGGGTIQWGDIGGTLSNQTDLQTALDGKLPSSGSVVLPGDLTISGNVRPLLLRGSGSGVSNRTYIAYQHSDGSNMFSIGDISVGENDLSIMNHLSGKGLFLRGNGSLMYGNDEVLTDASDLTGMTGIPDVSNYLPLDGSEAMQADLDFGGFDVQNAASIYWERTDGDQFTMQSGIVDTGADEEFRLYPLLNASAMGQLPFAYSFNNQYWTINGNEVLTSASNLTGMTGLPDASDFVDLTSNQSIAGDKTFSGTSVFSGTVNATGTLNTTGTLNAQSGDVLLPGNLTDSYTQTVITGGSDPTGSSTIMFNTSGVLRPLTATATDITYDGQSLLAGGGGTDDQTAAEVPFNNVPSGTAATNVQDAIDEAITYIPTEADDLFFNNVPSGMTATNVQDAIDEVAASGGTDNSLSEADQTITTDRVINVSALDTDFTIQINGSDMIKASNSPSANPSVVFGVYGNGLSADGETSYMSFNRAFKFHTDTGAPHNPAEGVSYYNTTSDELLIYDGTTWNGVGGSGGSQSFQTTFKDVTSTTYTLLSSDSEDNTKIRFANASDITVSEPASPADGDIFRLRQYGAGKVKTDFEVTVVPGTDIYAQTTGPGKEMILEYDATNTRWEVTGAFEEYSQSVIAASAPLYDFNAESLSLGTLASWPNDGSGVVAAASNATGSEQPTVIDESGKKAVEFDGTDDVLHIVNPTDLDFNVGTDDFTVILVRGADPGAGGVVTMFGDRDGTSSNNILVGATATDNFLYVVGTGGNIFNTGLSTTSAVIGEIRVDGNQVFTYVDGVLDTNGTSTGSDGSFHDFAIGARSDGTSNYGGTIRRILVWDRLLTGQERIDIVAELQTVN